METRSPLRIYSLNLLGAQAFDVFPLRVDMVPLLLSVAQLSPLTYHCILGCHVAASAPDCQSFQISSKHLSDSFCSPNGNCWGKRLNCWFWIRYLPLVKSGLSRRVGLHISSSRCRDNILNLYFPSFLKNRLWSLQMYGIHINHFLRCYLLLAISTLLSLNIFHNQSQTGFKSAMQPSLAHFCTSFPSQLDLCLHCHSKLMVVSYKS